MSEMNQNEALTPREVELFIELAKASADDPAIQSLIRTALVEARKPLVFAMEAIVAEIKPEPALTPESLAEMAAIASEFDKSGDPLLMKQAGVLDEILLTIGAQRAEVEALKKAQDVEVARIKQRAKETNPYTVAKTEHDRQNDVEGARKAITDKVKQYRPMEAPLNTRTCPDHPGAQMSRIAEHTYQCSMDKSIYNYETGFTTMKGNHVSGGDVANQTQSWLDRPGEITSFDSREGRLNR